MSDYQYYLVQRLNPQRPGSGKKGFDSLFSCDYMGSSEFEFGAVNDSLKRIRNQGDLVIRSAEMMRDGISKTIYFVASATGIEEKIEAFAAWFAQEQLNALERTNFDLLFTGRLQSQYIKTIAWWSLDDDITWTLDEDVAELLLKGLMG